MAETTPAATSRGLGPREVALIAWRRLWLILIITAVTVLVLGLRLKPSYTATATLQITAPPSGVVALFDQTTPYQNLRDDLTIARTDFIEAARSAEVRTRTVQNLNLNGAARDYVVDVIQVRDSDFLELRVEAAAPEAAQMIANTHAGMAIQYAAELRAKPAQAMAQFLADHIPAIRAKVETAERAGAQANSPAADEVTRQARQDLALWQRKLDEAETKATTGYASSHMQVVAPAALPSQPDTRKIQAQLALAGVGAFVAGACAAVVLELVLRRPRPARWS